ncbi:MAG: tRNA (adenosine(37)-N6)-threonylcarbamoyltransferase complex ATPase subunit type 1 TsaE [Paracoccaceae bacterium]
MTATLQTTSIEHALPTEAKATAFGNALGCALAPCDVLLLSGPLGAGKSHLARACIRALMGAPALTVPSPTYTLVNVYTRPSDRAEIWHADLYRLGAAEELNELGLEDAMEHAIALVEWPERWSSAPARHLHLDLTITGDNSRHLKLSTAGAGWDRVLTALEFLK